MDNYYKDLFKRLELAQQKIELGLDVTNTELKRCFEELKLLSIKVGNLRDSQLTCQARTAYDRLDTRVNDLEKTLQGTMDTALEVTKHLNVKRTSASTSMIPLASVKLLAVRSIPVLLIGALLGIGLVGYLIGVGFGLFR